MKHIGALFLKFVIIAIVLELVLLNMTLLSFSQILVISIVITVLAYIVGDMAVLPKSNNTVATVADIGLTFVALILFNFFYRANITFMPAFIAAVVIGIGEWIFHKFVSNKILPTQS